MTKSDDWWRTSGKQGAPPLYATQRNPDRLSEGAQVGVVAKHLGTPFLPWQQHVADVAGERLEDGSYAYQVIVVSVPRQTGKTTLLRAVGVHRAAVLGRDVFYTAQTGKDARERWSDLVKQIMRSPFKGLAHLTRRGGSEAVSFGDAGFRVFAPTPESLHGYTPPTVMIDEAFSHTEISGDMLMGAIGPAQFTIVDKQLWIVSTAGTAESVFLKTWLEKAIGGAPRVAGFVWAAEEGMDPFSPDTITAFHPAIGFVLNGKLMEPSDVLVNAETNSRAEYERAYLNRWTLTVSHLVPAEVWAELEADVPAPDDPATVVLAYDVAHDQTSATITATWTHRGRPHTRVVLYQSGMTWLADEAERLWREWSCTIAADDNGPARDITDELLRRGVPVQTTDTRAWSTATGRVLKLINGGGMTQAGEPVMAKAIAGLSTRVSNDGVAFSRRHSTGDVSPACALTVGVWFLDHQPEPEHQPLVVFSTR